LAILDVFIDLPLLSIIILNPVTKRSRNIIKATIQYSIRPRIAKEIKADETKILSAKGSKNSPSGDI
tara:strand:+ start:228 stop:428 length:201 start_codon:yes stop_codon:yes gene_type:complete